MKRIGKLPKKNMHEMFKTAMYSEQEKLEAADLIQNMIKWVPAQRFSAEQAMEHPFLKDVEI